MKKEHGFTLIEILVVIAIIGILSTIVLTSLGTARTKANDAKVQAELSSMRGQAELFFGEYHDYGSPLTHASEVCRTAGGGGSSSGTIFQPESISAQSDSLYTLIRGIPLGYIVTCYTDPSEGGSQATGWAVSVENPDATEHWCVDSTGAAKVYGASMDTVNAALCP